MRKSWFFLICGLLASPAALAGGMNPVGYNSWDYYVFGDGPAIYHILQSVKLLMLPAVGGGMFQGLLTAIALIGGFLVIVEAGFSPSKGVEKLIGYFLVLGFVVFFTMGARVNVTIDDSANGYFNTVTGVPAIVGVPAAVISEIGYKLEQGIEQDFSIPDGLKVSQSGMYDVMGRTLKDANQMVITDPNLRRDLTGYVENCVVPEIGLGRVSVEQLMDSNDLLSTFGQAATPSLLTPYYPVGTGGSPSALSDQGTLERCQTAYSSLSPDLQNYANALVNAQTAEWQSTGIMVPFGTAMGDVLEEAAAGGGGNPTVSNYSNPESYILQSALINTSRPAFQHAAAELGENPVMLSTAISQADQAQRSSWYTTVTVFHNMIGYVYIVLQAFVLALVPIIAAMLLIPGLGGKIFFNYLQVLLWLVLWGPLFAVDNFVAALNGGMQLHNLLAPGLTMMNSMAMSKATIDLSLAASFLGTLIPLLAWGIVKGSFAFTEFILTGMGASFGQQAGMIAASGNVSLGNTSLDNVGMNKYSTSITSDIGDSGVGLGIGAGALSSTAQLGGYNRMAGRTDVTAREGLQRSYAVQVGNTRVENLSRSEAQSIKTDMAHKANVLESAGHEVSDGLKRLQDNIQKYGIHNAAQATLAAKAAHDYSEAAQVASGHGIRGNISGDVGYGTGGKSLGVGADANLNGQIEKMKTLRAQASEDTSKLLQSQKQYAHDQGTSTSSGWDDKSSSSSAYRQQYDQSVSHAHDALDALNRTVSDMKNVQISEGYTHTESQTILPGAGSQGATGSAAVTPGGTLGQFTGQRAMSSGGARELVSGADRAASSARWAANRVPGEQAMVGGSVGAIGEAVGVAQGAVAGPGVTRRGVVSTADLLRKKETLHNMGIEGSAIIEERHVERRARGVQQGSVGGELLSGGVSVNVDRSSEQIDAIMKNEQM
ncbi:MAG: conjugal transfer protein TraG N-terminal domain-containing protein [Steroidobacteraceae bacterium]